MGSSCVVIRELKDEQGDMSGKGDVLIVHRGDLTSFVSALPAMKAIRAAHRGARVSILSAPPVDVLAGDMPYIDDVLEDALLDDPNEVSRVAQLLKTHKYGRIYDLERSAASEKLFNAMKPFPPVWCGAGRGMKFRYEAPAGMPVLEILRHQLALVGVEVDPEETPNARWAATARRNAPSLKPEFFGLERPYVLLAPSSQIAGAAPRWPIARFAGLAARLAANGVGVGVVTDPHDRATGRAVAQAAPDARDLASRADLTQVAALAAQASGVLGHADSGIVHLMAACGAATISIASSSEEGVAIGPAGPSVMTLNAPDPTQTTVDYAAQLISMFAHVGSLERRPEPEGPEVAGPETNDPKPSAED